MPGNLNFIQSHVSFTTRIASATAVVNLIKTSDGWKCWTLCTILKGLLDHSELPGPRGGQTEVVGW